MRLSVLKLDSVDAAHIVEVARKLVVADGLRKSNFADEVASLFVKILLNVGSYYDVDQGGLTDLVKMETRCFVGFEHLGSDLGQ